MLESHNWTEAAPHLDSHGFTVLPRVLEPEQCRALIALYTQEELFRSHVLMARHGFGQGEYRYFSYPLPPLVECLRSTLYPHLAAVANRWNAQLGVSAEYPPELSEFLSRCHAAGQSRPTPLLLRYGPGDYNCLHQDVYGEHLFPLQATFLLSRPEGEPRAERDQRPERDPLGASCASADFAGGEFVLVEQRPRMQSRAMVVPLRQGDAVIFAVNQRPVQGARGAYRVTLRHGVSEIRAGQRYTL